VPRLRSPSLFQRTNPSKFEPLPLPSPPLPSPPPEQTRQPWNRPYQLQERYWEKMTEADWSIYVFYTFVVVNYIFYFCILFDISSTMTSKYFSRIHWYFQVYISLLLIWRYNPLRTKLKFVDNDKIIIFTCAVTLLFLTIMTTYAKEVESSIEYIKGKVKSLIQ